MRDHDTSLVLNQRVISRNMRFASDNVQSRAVDLSFVQRPSQVFRVDDRSLDISAQNPHIVVVV